ncbi:hypothetical protein NKG60_06685 [Mesorhizobium sp. M1428]|uniref:hypothetical protein n=2 Tax=unclassified Mesorhizobium TaxID=325217 RepID=UPI003338455D
MRMATASFIFDLSSRTEPRDAPCASTVAVDLLLRRAGFDPTDAVVSANSVVPMEGGTVVNWVVMADEHVFLLQSTPKGGVLRGSHEESLAEADRRELEEYFDQAAAAGA